MATTNLAVHIPPDANPTNITQMTLVLANSQCQAFETVRELLDYTESRGVGSRTEMQSMATSLGLLNKSPKGIGLSPQGFAFTRMRDSVQADILHYLMYAGWSAKDPLNFLPSWAYRLCCDRYWEAQNVVLNAEYLNRQVEETISRARSAFLEMGLSEFQEISFSSKSLAGARKWIDAVQPPVVENGVFARRAFCPPELLLLAVGYVLRDEVDATGVDILLSREKRDAICKVCLLDPHALDRALDWMLPIFPNVIAPGTSAGFYGRFIRLYKIPVLEDIIR